MTLTVQFNTMITMVLGGFYLGIALDTLRRFSPYWRRSFILSYCLEIGFWLIQTSILFYLLFQTNGGELRVYVFAASLLGFAMYQVFATRVYKLLLEQIIKCLITVYRLIENVVNVLIIAPIWAIIKAVIIIILFILQMLLSILLFVLKVVWTPFKWVFIGIYKLIPNNLKKLLHKLAGIYSRMKNRCIRWIKLLTFRRR